MDTPPPLNPPEHMPQVLQDNIQQQDMYPEEPNGEEPPMCRIEDVNPDIKTYIYSIQKKTIHDIYITKHNQKYLTYIFET